MTTFSVAIAICGLTQQGAVEFLEVSPGNVEDWVRGETAPPREVWGRLADLYARIEDAADNAATELEVDLMDPHAMNHIEVERGMEPLPNGARKVAGAMALLLSLQLGVS
jgi:hypothetical protein